MADYEPEVSEWVENLMDKRDRLAMSLLDIAYGDGAWDDADAELRKNYELDAWDILMASPQLLGLEAEENLRAMGLLKEDK